MMRRESLAAGLMLSILAGCSFAPKQTQPVVVADIPDDYESAPDSGAYQPTQWWTVFNDPVLDRLVDTALAANLDLNRKGVFNSASFELRLNLHIRRCHVDRYLSIIRVIVFIVIISSCFSLVFSGCFILLLSGLILGCCRCIDINHR